MNHIDRLPRNCHFSEAVANDREHMEMLVDASGGAPAETRPRMSSWSPEVEAITQVSDLLKVLVALTVMANSKKGAKKPDTTPAPRPGTVLSEVQRDRKRRQHNKIVSMLLPKRGEEAAE